MWFKKENDTKLATAIKEGADYMDTWTKDVSFAEARIEIRAHLIRKGFDYSTAEKAARKLL